MGHVNPSLLDEEVSLNTNVSELSSHTQSSLISETKRRRSKLQKLLTSYNSTNSDTASTTDQRNKGIFNAETTSDDYDDEAKNATKSNKSNGIMIVRTQKESLLYTDGRGELVAKHRRKRKMLRRRMKIAINRRESKDNIDISESNSTTGDASIASSFTNSSSSSLLYEKVKVTFGDIEIREYPIIPGDNPTVLRGPPLAIDWDYISEEMIDLDLFESMRTEKRRSSTQFKIPSSVRYDLLVDLGFSFNEIREASRQAAVVRRNRLRTIEMLHTSGFQESVENLRRKLSKPFHRRKKNLVTKAVTNKNKRHNRKINNQKKDRISTQTNNPIDMASRRRTYNLSASVSSSQEFESNTSNSQDSETLLVEKIEEISKNLHNEDEDQIKSMDMDVTKRTKHYDLSLISAKIPDESDVKVLKISSFESDQTDTTYPQEKSDCNSTIDSSIVALGERENFSTLSR